MQRGPGGVTQGVQCGSTSLSRAQHNYSMAELELLVVQWALEKCSYYMRGAHGLRVFTDHAPLVGLERCDLCEINNPRVVRLLEKTRGFCFSLENVKGSINLFADALSRQHREESEVEDVPRFGVRCSVRKVGGRMSEDVVKFREDIQLLVEKGAECSEYR